MRVKSLNVLCMVFAAACVGRAGVLAADAVTAPARPDARKPAEAPQCIDGAYAASIAKTIDAIEARETKTAEREQTLRIFEAQIDKRLGELDAASAALAAAVREAESKRDADLAKVAAVYEGMKAKDAGAIIDKMDTAFAAGLIATMSSESAAAIVAAMAPDKAYAVTVAMANRLAPRAD